MGRLKLFLDNRDESFKDKHIVNGVETNTIDELLDDFNWGKVYHGIPTKSYHGDFHFDMWFMVVMKILFIRLETRFCW